MDINSAIEAFQSRNREAFCFKSLSVVVDARV